MSHQTTRVMKKMNEAKFTKGDWEIKQDILDLRIQIKVKLTRKR